MSPSGKNAAAEDDNFLIQRCRAYFDRASILHDDLCSPLLDLIGVNPEQA